MIKIYGNQTCAFCLRAKRLAQSYNLKYEWIDTDVDMNHDQLKKLLPSFKTIPQIWWYDKHLGGYTEFARAVEETIGGFGDGKL